MTAQHLLSTRNDEAGCDTTRAGPKEHQQRRDSGDEAADWQAAVATHDKRFITLQAQFALRGFSLIVTGVNGMPLFSVGRLGVVRDFASIAEVEAFARQAGCDLPGREHRHGS